MKLNIELVPSTSWCQNLRSELSDKEWKTIQQKCFEKAGKVCEICGGKGRSHDVECHEKWHYNDTTHVQTLLGVIALCPSCHRVKHMGNAERMGMLEQTLKHYAKINKMPLEHAKLMAAKEFDIWRERSQHEWEVCLEPVLSNLQKT